MATIAAFWLSRPERRALFPVTLVFIIGATVFATVINYYWYMYEMNSRRFAEEIAREIRRVTVDGDPTNAQFWLKKGHEVGEEWRKAGLLRYVHVWTLLTAAFGAAVVVALTLVWRSDVRTTKAKDRDGPDAAA